MTAAAAADDRVVCAYLGFRLAVGEKDVEIYDGRLRRLATVTSVKKARLFCRGYRRGC